MFLAADQCWRPCRGCHPCCPLQSAIAATARPPCPCSANFKDYLASARPPPSLACPDDAKFEPPSGNSIGAFPRPPAVLSPDPCRSSSYLASQAMPVLGPHAPVLSCLAARGRTRLLSHSIRHSNLYSMHPGSFFSTFTLFQPGPGELILHSFPSGPVLSRPFCPRSTRTDPQPRCLGPD